MLSDGSPGSPSSPCFWKAALQAHIILHRNWLGVFAEEENIGWQHPWVFSPGLVEFPNVEHSNVLFRGYNKPEAWLLMFSETELMG